jgi:hypothetical protein
MCRRQTPLWVVTPELNWPAPPIHHVPQEGRSRRLTTIGPWRPAVMRNTRYECEAGRLVTLCSWKVRHGYRESTTIMACPLPAPIEPSGRTLRIWNSHAANNCGLRGFEPWLDLIWSHVFRIKLATNFSLEILHLLAKIWSCSGSCQLDVAKA